MKKLLVAQSGGPTAAINSTLSGVLSYANIAKDSIERVIGAVNGIEGVLNEKFIDITDKLDNIILLDELSNTPSSALGSCRYKLKNDVKELAKIISIFRKNNIGYFVYIGGNDSMDTVYKLSRYCKENNIDDIKIVGAPKTIDNDLEGIDHCPGFGSAAKYIASTLAEIERDCNVYNTKSVTIVEVMGRNAGWLTAAASLSCESGGNGVDLIYLCEVPFDTSKFIDDVREILEKKNNVLIAISEGIKNKEGIYISEEVQSDVKDMFGHKYISGSGKVLENIVRDSIGCKVRSIELNVMQRCSSHILSKTDIEESKLLGMKACESVICGKSGVMSTIERLSNNPYKTQLSIIDISKVANFEKKVPLYMINEQQNNVTQDMIDYLKPLIQGEVYIKYQNGVPKHTVLY